METVSNWEFHRIPFDVTETGLRIPDPFARSSGHSGIWKNDDIYSAQNSRSQSYEYKVTNEGGWNDAEK